MDNRKDPLRSGTIFGLNANSPFLKSPVPITTLNEPLEHAPPSVLARPQPRISTGGFTSPQSGNRSPFASTASTPLRVSQPVKGFDNLILQSPAPPVIPGFTSQVPPNEIVFATPTKVIRQSIGATHVQRTPTPAALPSPGASTPSKLSTPAKPTPPPAKISLFDFEDEREAPAGPSTQSPEPNGTQVHEEVKAPVTPKRNGTAEKKQPTPAAAKVSPALDRKASEPKTPSKPTPNAEEKKTPTPSAQTSSKKPTPAKVTTATIAATPATPGETTPAKSESKSQDKNKAKSSGRSFPSKGLSESPIVLDSSKKAAKLPASLDASPVAPAGFSKDKMDIDTPKSKSTATKPSKPSDEDAMEVDSAPAKGNAKAARIVKAEAAEPTPPLKADKKTTEEHKIKVEDSKDKQSKKRKADKIEPSPEVAAKATQAKAAATKQQTDKNLTESEDDDEKAKPPPNKKRKLTADEEAVKQAKAIEARSKRTSDAASGKSGAASSAKGRADDAILVLDSPAPSVPVKKLISRSHSRKAIEEQKTVQQTETSPPDSATTAAEEKIQRSEAATEAEASPIPKKKPGRPKKPAASAMTAVEEKTQRSEAAAAATDTTKAEASPEPKRKPGRPKKKQMEMTITAVPERVYVEPDSGAVKEAKKDAPADVSVSSVEDSPAPPPKASSKRATKKDTKPNDTSDPVDVSIVSEDSPAPPPKASSKRTATKKDAKPASVDASVVSVEDSPAPKASAKRTATKKGSKTTEPAPANGSVVSVEVVSPMASSKRTPAKNGARSNNASASSEPEVDWRGLGLWSDDTPRRTSRDRSNSAVPWWMAHNAAATPPVNRQLDLSAASVNSSASSKASTGSKKKTPKPEPLETSTPPQDVAITTSSSSAKQTVETTTTTTKRKMGRPKKPAAEIEPIDISDEEMDEPMTKAKGKKPSAKPKPRGSSRKTAGSDTEGSASASTKTAGAKKKKTGGKKAKAQDYEFDDTNVAENLLSSAASLLMDQDDDTEGQELAASTATVPEDPMPVDEKQRGSEEMPPPSAPMKKQDSVSKGAATKKAKGKAAPKGKRQAESDEMDVKEDKGGETEEEGDPDEAYPSPSQAKSKKAARTSKNTKKATAASKSKKAPTRKATEDSDNEGEDGWSAKMVKELESAFRRISTETTEDFWADVADAVGHGKSADECCDKYELLHPTKGGKKKGGSKKEAVFSPLAAEAKMKTLKDKKKLRDIIKQDMENHDDDIFNSTPMKAKHNQKRISLGSDTDDFDIPSPPRPTSNPKQNYDAGSEDDEDDRNSVHELLRDVRAVNRDKTDSYINKLKQPKTDLAEKPAAERSHKAKSKAGAGPKTGQSSAAKRNLEEAVAVIQQLEDTQERQKVLEGRMIDSDDDMADLEDLIDDDLE